MCTSMTPSSLYTSYYSCTLWYLGVVGLPYEQGSYLEAPAVCRPETHTIPVADQRHAPYPFYAPKSNSDTRYNPWWNNRAIGKERGVVYLILYWDLEEELGDGWLLLLEDDEDKRWVFVVLFWNWGKSEESKQDQRDSSFDNLLRRLQVMERQQRSL